MSRRTSKRNDQAKWADIAPPGYRELTVGEAMRDRCASGLDPVDFDFDPETHFSLLELAADRFDRPLHEAYAPTWPDIRRRRDL